MSMLTIKHIEASGLETIIQAHQVSFWPHGQEGDQPARKPKLQAFGCTAGNDGGAIAGGLCTFGDGRVYVMNDAGATVGSYDLD